MVRLWPTSDLNDSLQGQLDTPDEELHLWTSSPHPPAAEQHHGPYSLRVGSLISWEISLSLSVQICPSSDE